MCVLSTKPVVAATVVNAGAVSGTGCLRHHVPRVSDISALPGLFPPPLSSDRDRSCLDAENNMQTTVKRRGQQGQRTCSVVEEELKCLWQFPSLARGCS